MFKKLRAKIERLLERQAKQTEPAPSVFGPDADRQREEQDAKNEWDIAVAKEEGKRGW